MSDKRRPPKHFFAVAAASAGRLSRLLGLSSLLVAIATLGLICYSPKVASAEMGVDYLLGNIDGIKIRVPSDMILSDFGSDPNPAWHTPRREPNNFNRPIEFFDLRLTLPELQPSRDAKSLILHLDENTVEVDISHHKFLHHRHAFINLLERDLAGQGADRPYTSAREFGRFRHWRLVGNPTSSASDVDLFYDKGQKILIACSRYNLTVKTGQLNGCNESFEVPDLKVAVDMSYDGKWFDSDERIAMQMRRLLKSFVVGRKG